MEKITKPAAMSQVIIFACICFQLALGYNIKALAESSGPSNEQVNNLIVTEMAENLLVTYEVLNNRESRLCDKNRASGNCFHAAITLGLNIKNTLKDWRIYFSHLSPVRKVMNKEFKIVHVNGDLHYIEPTKNFKGWQGNLTKKIEFIADFWHISEFDSPPNYFLVSGDLPAVIIQSTLAKTDKDSGLEFMPHVKAMNDVERQLKRSLNDLTVFASPENLFSQNQNISQQPLDTSLRIIPKPAVVIPDPEHGRLDTSEGLKLVKNEFSINYQSTAIKRLNRLGLKFSEQGKVAVIINKLSDVLNREAYQLKITRNNIIISAVDKAGVFYALQSIGGLKNLNNSWLPVVDINDSPRFAFRGVLLDVARNFRDKNFVIKLLDQMAAYKLNKLHLHLGDDEGWRLEIAGLPELTEVGAVRCYELKERNCLLPQLGSGPARSSKANGFYSIEDYKDILVAARKRQIEVIPSFDMPGHSRAAVVSMQTRYKKYFAEGNIELATEYLLSDPNDQSNYSSVQFYNDNTLNVCLESTYHFIEKVISEVIQQHKDAKAPLKTYHIGADETPGAWKSSPICDAFTKEKGIKIERLSQYFIHRISAFINQQNIQVAGWSDGLSKVEQSEMPKNVQVNAWGPLYWNGFKEAHKMANHDWQVIVSSPDVTYFDFPYEADPKERGYYWGTRYTNTRQVFQFMPENLPLHGEIWTDRENLSMTLDDRYQPQTADQAMYQPLQKDKKFKGLQAQLWGEMVRTDDIAEYLLFPRLIALAERAWHRPDWEPEYLYQGAIYSQESGYFSPLNKQKREWDWQLFANTLAQKEMPKLELENWLFRLPTPGAMIISNQLKINTPFPGLKVQYRINNGDWQLYSFKKKIKNILPTDTIYVRSISPNGTRFSRITKVGKKS